MKILFVCGAGRVFGKETVTLCLMKGLRDRGHEVKCVTSTWSNGDFEKRVGALSIPFTCLPLGFISKSLSLSAIGMTFEQMRKLPSLWFGYKRIRDSLKPDLVVHSAFHHVFLLAPLLRNSTNIFHVHDAFAPTRFYRTIFKALSRRLDAFVGVSSFVSDTLTSLGVPQAKVHYVLNGIAIDNGLLRSTNGNGTKQEERRTAEGLPIRIGIVGQVAEWKGHEDLIDALRILDEKGEKFVCKIFGDGSEEFAARLQNQIAKYGLTDKVEWMGFVDNRQRIFDGIDVCVAPSRLQEAFGMVAAEAAIHGLPVIASRMGGLPEVIVNGETGYLVDAKSPGQIAEKICALSASPATLLEMGRNAAEHIKETLNARKMTDEMEILFRSLIVERRSRGQ